MIDRLRRFLIGGAQADGSDGLALSGDITVNSSGVATIANDAVTTAKIAADAVTAAEIADDAVTRDQVHANVAGTGLAQHADGSLKVATGRIVALGTTDAANDGTGTITITASGVLATDVVVVTLRASTAAVNVRTAIPSPDTITVTLSGAGGVGTQVDYVVFRAVA